MSQLQSAQLAAGDVFATLTYSTTPIILERIRELEDMLTVVSFYLAQERSRLQGERQTSLNEYFPQICNGHVGHHVPSNGADYELPTGSTNGELVEVVVQGPGFDSSSSMLLV